MMNIVNIPAHTKHDYFEDIFLQVVLAPGSNPPELALLTNAQLDTLSALLAGYPPAGFRCPAPERDSRST